MGQLHARPRRRRRGGPRHEGERLGLLSTIGSLSLCRSLLRAGLVDRFRVGMFPVITGATGRTHLRRLPGRRPRDDRAPDLRRPHPAGRVQAQRARAPPARRPCVTSPSPQRAGCARPARRRTRGAGRAALARRLDLIKPDSTVGGRPSFSARHLYCWLRTIDLAGAPLGRCSAPLRVRNPDGASIPVTGVGSARC